jgi:Carboxypeptidase regulatory-like domain
MVTHAPIFRLFLTLTRAVLLLAIVSPTQAQSTAALLGRVIDANNAVVPRAKITVRNMETAMERIGETDDQGNYQIGALPVGAYRVEVRARGFKTKIVARLDLR